MDNKKNNSEKFEIWECKWGSGNAIDLFDIFDNLVDDDLIVLKNEKLEKYSTIHIGGVAKIVALPKNFSAFLRVVDVVKCHNISYYILGNGSNTLCSSKGFSGVVICTKFMNKTKIIKLFFKPTKKIIKTKFYENNYAISKKALKNNRKNEKKLINKYQKQQFAFQTKTGGLLKNHKISVFAECGTLLPLLSKNICELGYSGLEFACGIPASCGGAVKMNAGAFGGQMADIVSRVLIFNTKTFSIYYKNNEKFIKKHDFSIKNAKCNEKFAQNDYICEMDDCHCVEEFSELYRAEYRETNIEDCEFIIGAEFIFTRGNKKEIENKRNENMRKRLTTQNVGYPSLGSVFKRCENFIPSKYIDECGFKGLTLGGAQVSKIHAGYIINRANATSDDIIKLLKFLQNYICKNSNIVLQYELKFLGDMNEEK